MNDEIGIRTVNQNDYCLLRKLAEKCPPLDIHTPYTYWVIANFFGDTSFILSIDDVPIGFISCVNNKDSLLIWQIGVCQPYQRRGYATKLLDIAIQKTASLRINDIYFSITEENSTSKKLFSNYCANNKLLMSTESIMSFDNIVAIPPIKAEILFKVIIGGEQHAT